MSYKTKGKPGRPRKCDTAPIYQGNAAREKWTKMTPGYAGDIMLAALGRILNEVEERASKELQEYCEKLGKNAHYALRWDVESSTKAAAMLQLVRELKGYIEQWATTGDEYYCRSPYSQVQVICHQLKRDVLRMAASHSMSTNLGSNLVERMDLLAKAKLLEPLEAMLDFYHENGFTFDRMWGFYY